MRQSKLKGNPPYHRLQKRPLTWPMALPHMSANRIILITITLSLPCRLVTSARFTVQKHHLRPRRHCFENFLYVTYVQAPSFWPGHPSRQISYTTACREETRGDGFYDRIAKGADQDRQESHARPDHCPSHECGFSNGNRHQGGQDRRLIFARGCVRIKSIICALMRNSLANLSSL